MAKQTEKVDKEVEGVGEGEGDGVLSDGKQTSRALGARVGEYTQCST